MYKSLVILLYCSASVAADPIVVVNEWSKMNSIVLSQGVQEMLLREIEVAVKKVSKDPKLAPRYNSKMMENATIEYLDNLNDDNKSPPLLSLLVNQFGEHGLGRIYPSKFPKLYLKSGFVMPSIILNDREIDVVDSKEIELWINLGSNRVETRGGGTSNCTYSVHGEKGERYEYSCGLGKK